MRLHPLLHLHMQLHLYTSYYTLHTVTPIACTVLTTPVMSRPNRSGVDKKNIKVESLKRAKPLAISSEGWYKNTSAATFNVAAEEFL